MIRFFHYTEKSHELKCNIDWQRLAEADRDRDRDRQTDGGRQTNRQTGEGGNGKDWAAASLPYWYDVFIIMWCFHYNEQFYITFQFTYHVFISTYISIDISTYISINYDFPKLLISKNPKQFRTTKIRSYHISFVDFHIAKNIKTNKIWNDQYTYRNFKNTKGATITYFNITTFIFRNYQI